MDPKKFYKFCPKCGGDLSPNPENYLTCQKCFFKLFVNSASAVGAIIENDKGEILFAKRKYDPGKGEWDIPGGFVSPNEDLTTATERELEEELGVRVKMGKIIGAYKDTYLYQGVVVPLLDIIVTAEIIEGNLKPNDDVESFEFISKENVKKLPLWCPSIKRGLDDYLANS